MTSDAERASKQDDIKAFFALSRGQLYGRGALVLALTVGLPSLLFWLRPSLELWLAPIETTLLAITIAGLRRSPAGRGAVWTLTSQWGLTPRITNLTWVVLTVLLVAFAAYAAGPPE